MKTAFCFMATNRLKEASERVNEMTGYVDEIILVDGGSVDDSVLYFRNRKDVKLYLHKWIGRWPAQRNNYLQHANELGIDWIVVLDSDESLSEVCRKNLRMIIEKAEAMGVTMVPVLAHDVSMEGDEIVHENDSTDFRKMAIYKNLPGTQYSGTVHEGLNTPSGWRGCNLEDVVKKLNEEGKVPDEEAGLEHYRYSHIKQNGVTWMRDINYLIHGGGGMNLGDRNPHWKELLDALEKDTTPPDGQIVTDVMVRGEIGPNFRQWIIDHRNMDEVICDGRKDGCSEMRAFYSAYFRLWHPEEAPEEFKDEKSF